jgi:hypothetical protein
MAKKEKPKGTPQKTAQNQTKMGDYLGKKPTSTPTRKLTAEEVRATVGMEIDDEVTKSDDGISEVLAQREEEVMGPFAGADDSPKGERKQADKKGLAPLENTVTEGLITAAEAKRRARRKKEEEEAQEQRIQTAVRILHCLCQNSTCPLPPLTAAGRAVKYSRKHSLDKVNVGILWPWCAETRPLTRMLLRSLWSCTWSSPPPFSVPGTALELDASSCQKTSPQSTSKPTPEKCGTLRPLR